MIVISGCPRSGTSLMMDLMRVTFGEDRIMGEKFPQEARIKRIYGQQKDETENERQARIYLFEKNNPNWRTDLEQSKDMNPNGFWECMFTVGGLRRTNIPSEWSNKIIKIVSQGLSRTNAEHVNRVIFMLRDPWSVAKSQERLKRQMPFDITRSRQAGIPGIGRSHDLAETLRIHTPEMFIRVTVQAAKWLLDHPDIPVHQVLFDDLIARPEQTLTGVRDFLGEGDFSEAIQQIEPSLKRSKREELDHELWEDAEYVYSRMLEKDYQGVVDYFADRRKERATHRVAMRWHCPRFGQIVTDKQCELCRTNATVRGNFRKTAEKRHINWRNEPCLYEVAYGPQSMPKVTIEQSIAQNFWADAKGLVENSSIGDGSR